MGRKSRYNPQTTSTRPRRSFPTPQHRTTASDFSARSDTNGMAHSSTVAFTAPEANGMYARFGVQALLIQSSNATLDEYSLG